MSAPLTGPFPATNELVAVAYLGTRVPGIVASQVATSLPRDVSTWQAQGFVQVQALPGGSPIIDVPIRRPVLQVDCWATNTTTSGTSSTKAPWSKANRLAELIRLATESRDFAYGKPIDLGPNFTGARVQSAYFMTEPQRVLSDPQGFARYTFDLALVWVSA